MRKPHATRTNQHGAVAIVVAICIVVLVAFAGLALDLGQMFISKTELQNAADACALAAARELNTAPTDITVLTRAENAGITTGIRNRTAFQKTPVTFATDRDVTFSNAFAGGYVTKGAAPPNVRYVRCTTQRTGIVPWFMQVLGIGNQTVPAFAVASLQGSANACIIPLGMCRKTLPVTCDDPSVIADANGLCKGQWYAGRFGSGGGATGNFNWIDFTPHGGGSSEIGAALEGPGFCNVAVGATVHAETGVNQGVAVSWNSRFGLYKNGSGQPSADTAPPDFTGFAWTTTNWLLGHDAFPDFLARRIAFAPYDGSDGLGVSNSYTPSTQATHQQKGADRRLVYMPIVDCAGWGPNHSTAVTGLACALMLTPNDGPNNDIVLEFRAEAGDADNPCATFGQQTGPGGTGPRVPNLVQ